MGTLSEPTPVMMFLAAFSRFPEALEWAKERACEKLGPIALESDVFLFDDTDYYEPTMGADLKKVFWAFERLADPACLAELKRQTNAWEETYVKLGQHSCARPLNLDPGYLTLGKLVLASTKDHMHRIYLSDGIYAEVTLFFRHGAWRASEWTFADYRREDYQAFFTSCRNRLHRDLREGRSA